MTWPAVPSFRRKIEAMSKKMAIAPNAFGRALREFNLKHSPGSSGMLSGRSVFEFDLGKTRIGDSFNIRAISGKRKPPRLGSASRVVGVFLLAPLVGRAEVYGQPVNERKHP